MHKSGSFPITLVADATILGDIADGLHITTQKYLELVDAHARPGMRVLDVGTGTGILAIAAALHGASVVAVDINPLCHDFVTENLNANNLDVRTLIGTIYDLDLTNHDRFDLILRNIDDVEGLIEDLPRLSRLLKAEGLLIATFACHDPEKILPVVLECIVERGWKLDIITPLVLLNGRLPNQTWAIVGLRLLLESKPPFVPMEW